MPVCDMIAIGGSVRMLYCETSAELMPIVSGSLVSQECPGETWVIGEPRRAPVRHGLAGIGQFGCQLARQGLVLCGSAQTGYKSSRHKSYQLEADLCHLTTEDGFAAGSQVAGQKPSRMAVPAQPCIVVTTLSVLHWEPSLTALSLLLQLHPHLLWPRASGTGVHCTGQAGAPHLRQQSRGPDGWQQPRGDTHSCGRRHRPPVAALGAPLGV